MSATYLITGGAGNLACQLTFKLKNAEQIILFDIAEAPVDAVDRRCIFVRGDITDPSRLHDVFEKYVPNKVVHAASLLSGHSERDPRLAWRVNMDATFELLAIASDLGCAVFFPSSIASFGQLPSSPSNQSADPQQWPCTLYGVTKLAVERLGWYMHVQRGLDFRCIRLPIVISPHAPSGAASAFASRAFVEAKQHGRFTFPLDPDTRGPMVYWRDAVQGMADLLDAPARQLTRRVYGIRAIAPSAGEIANVVRHHLPTADLDFNPDEAVTRIIRSWASDTDDSAARHDWAWNPRFDLDAIARDMLGERTP